MDSFDYAEALQQGVLFGFTLITSVFFVLRCPRFFRLFW